MLSYTDIDFLPTFFRFDPIDCPGSQAAELVVPQEAPNGAALVTLYVTTPTMIISRLIDEAVVLVCLTKAVTMPPSPTALTGPT